MSYEEWCRLGGVTPEYARAWVNFINIGMWNNRWAAQKITKAIADSWVAEALG